VCARASCFALTGLTFLVVLITASVSQAFSRRTITEIRFREMAFTSGIFMYGVILYREVLFWVFLRYNHVKKKEFYAFVQSVVSSHQYNQSPGFISKALTISLRTSNS
jgi:hypothetical protein